MKYCKAFQGFIQFCDFFSAELTYWAMTKLCFKTEI